jgi:hypothetical protein
VIRLVQVVAVVAVAGVAAVSASATEATIIPGVGVGKVKLGMTQAQVLRLLGKDYAVNERATVRGAAYRELQWNFASWSVGLLQTGKTWRVVQVGTTVRGQRTPNKIGAGSTLKSVLRAFPHVMCGKQYRAPTAFGPPSVGLMLVQKGGLQTVFWVSAPTRAGTGTWRVYETTVRQSFRPLGLVGPGHECQNRWREVGVP